MYIYWKNWKNITQPTLFLEMGQTAPKTAHSGLFSLTICVFEFYPLFTSDISIIYMVNNVKLWTIYVESVLNYALLIICTLSCQFFLYYFVGLHLIGTKRNQYIIWIAAWTKGLLQCLWVSRARPARAHTDLTSFLSRLSMSKTTTRPHPCREVGEGLQLSMQGGWRLTYEISMLNISMHQPCKIPTLANSAWWIFELPRFYHTLG